MFDAHHLEGEAGIARYPESHYQLAGWAVTLRVMNEMVHEVDFNSAAESDHPREIFFRLCRAATHNYGRFISLTEHSCAAGSPLYSSTHAAGLTITKQPESKTIINPLVKRTADVFADRGTVLDCAILGRLEGEIKLVTDFYRSNKQEIGLFQAAKKAANYIELPNRIKKIHTDASFYIGLYERQREEGWEN